MRYYFACTNRFAHGRCAGIDDVQSVVMSAVGGGAVTTTVEGRERYTVNVRYLRDFRSDVNRLNRVLVPVMGGQTQIPVPNSQR